MPVCLDASQRRRREPPRLACIVFGCRRNANNACVLNITIGGECSGRECPGPSNRGKVPPRCHFRWAAPARSARCRAPARLHPHLRRWLEAFSLPSTRGDRLHPDPLCHHARSASPSLGVLPPLKWRGPRSSDRGLRFCVWIAAPLAGCRRAAGNVQQRRDVAATHVVLRFSERELRFVEQASFAMLLMAVEACS